MGFYQVKPGGGGSGGSDSLEYNYTFVLQNPGNNALSTLFLLPRNITIKDVIARNVDDTGVNASPSAAVNLELYVGSTLVTTLNISTPLTTWTAPANTNANRDDWVYFKINANANGLKNVSISLRVVNR